MPQGEWPQRDQWRKPFEDYRNNLMGQVDALRQRASEIGPAIQGQVQQQIQPNLQMPPVPQMPAMQEPRIQMPQYPQLNTNRLM